MAQWIADKRNPLTARVLVNQVWMRLTGSSFVPDVSDFGLQAADAAQQDILNRAPTEKEHEVSLDALTALRNNRLLCLQAVLNHNDFVTLQQITPQTHPPDQTAASAH